MRTFIRTIAPYLLALINISLFTTIMGLVTLISFCLLPFLYLTSHPVTPPNPPRPTTTYTADDLVSSHSCSTAFTAPFTSPFADDVRTAAEKLYSLPSGTRCVHTANAGKDCTALMSAGTAAVFICGDRGSSVYCHQAAWAAEAVARNCEWSRVSEGTVFFQNAPGVGVVVAHSGVGGNDRMGI